jgi:predicted ATPase
MRITRLRIENFRQFKKPVELTLEPITVLIGLNNSGKSSVLQALNVFQYCLETCRTRNGNGNGSKGAWSLKNRNIGLEEFGRLPFSTPADLWPQGRTQRTSIRLSATFEKGAEIAFEIALQFNVFNIKPTSTGEAVPDAILGAEIRLIPVFTGLLPREELLIEPARLDRERSQRHGDIVRNLLLVLKREHPKRYDLLRAKLEEVYPGSRLDVAFDDDLAARAASARIDSTYRDEVLTRDRDLIVAGSGFHQTVQILAGVLQPGAHTILLDEPDAHLHARLQHRLMEVLRDLAETEDLQFVVATHSPQILRAVPPESLRICERSALTPFPAVAPMDLLDGLGALERMDLVPLLKNRRVLFVEDRDDRGLIEAFAQKELGEAQANEFLANWTFLYTHQEPVAGGVRQKAALVRDLLEDPGLAALGHSGPLKFLAIGDRDYRSGEEIEEARRALGNNVDLKIWQRNEIENYLLDIHALRAALLAELKAKDREKEAGRLSKALQKTLERSVAMLRTEADDSMASHMHQVDKKLEVKTAMARARQYLDRHWGDGTNWCDAKKVLAGLRTWAQENKVRAQVFDPRNIIQHMKAVPGDVKALLAMLEPKSKLIKGRYPNLFDHETFVDGDGR